jgi:hypothetical protein
MPDYKTQKWVKDKKAEKGAGKKSEGASH